MGLVWQVCGACEERHALQRNGTMSIHTTAAGDRCTGPVIKTPRPVPAAEKAPREPRVNDRPELQAAFDAAADDRLERRVRAANERFDRRIYATRGVRTVSGGLPGHGKR